MGLFRQLWNWLYVLFRPEQHKRGIKLREAIKKAIVIEEDVIVALNLFKIESTMSTIFCPNLDIIFMHRLNGTYKEYQIYEQWIFKISEDLDGEKIKQLQRSCSSLYGAPGNSD